MLQRMAGFGIILKMLPARRAYPTHAGQPMAAAVRGFRSSPYLPKRGRIHANVLRGARFYRPPAPMLPGSVTRLTTLNRRAGATGSRRGKIADCA